LINRVPSAPAPHTHRLWRRPSKGMPHAPAPAVVLTLPPQAQPPAREPPFPATNQPYEIRGVSVGVLDNGLVKANVDYWDVNALLIQVTSPATTEPAP
jgi:hypothetical protein